MKVLLDFIPGFILQRTEDLLVDTVDILASAASKSKVIVSPFIEFVRCGKGFLYPVFRAFPDAPLEAVYQSLCFWGEEIEK